MPVWLHRRSLAPYSGLLRVKRESLLAWGDLLLELCPPEDWELVLAMEAEMLHALGHATRDDEQRSRERLASYQECGREVLAKRQRGKVKL